MFEQTICYMEQLVDKKKVPGISYAFVTSEKVLKGKIGVKQQIPDIEEIDESTLYDMASLTKMICTNTVILKLIELNKLSIDQPLNYYLPEFEDKQVTIRHLLTHTSGINPYIKNRNNLNQKDLKQAILKLHSDETRGSHVKYTDTGTILLGFLIEKIYEKDLHDVFQKEVLTPLKMTDSFFTGFDKKRAAPTEITATRGLIKGEVHDPKAFVLKEHCGSAGLFSTLDDTIKFTQMMLNKGKVGHDIFLNEKTITNLEQDYTNGNPKARSLGWDLIETNQNNLLYHTGYTGTFIMIDLKKREAFIFLSNRVHPTDNREEYIELRDHLIEIYLNETTKR